MTNSTSKPGDDRRAEDRRKAGEDRRMSERGPGTDRRQGDRRLDLPPEPKQD
jgi:hypothetical protein